MVRFEPMPAAYICKLWSLNLLSPRINIAYDQWLNKGLELNYFVNENVNRLSSVSCWVLVNLGSIFNKCFDAGRLKKVNPDWRNWWLAFALIKFLSSLRSFGNFIVKENWGWNSLRGRRTTDCGLVEREAKMCCNAILRPTRCQVIIMMEHVWTVGPRPDRRWNSEQ